MVYAAFNQGDTIMSFGFPRDEREALVASEPDEFLMPRSSGMRYRWVCARLDAIDVEELRERLGDAWRTCVPTEVAAAYEGGPMPVLGTIWTPWESSRVGDGVYAFALAQ